MDDPVGCIGTHAVAGIWGMIAVGLFVEEEPLEGFSAVRGLFKGGSAKLLGVQILTCVVITVWSGFTTWIQLFLINKISPIRLSHEEEMIGAMVLKCVIYLQVECAKKKSQAKLLQSIEGRTNLHGLARKDFAHLWSKLS